MNIVEKLIKTKKSIEQTINELKKRQYSAQKSYEELKAVESKANEAIEQTVINKKEVKK